MRFVNVGWGLSILCLIFALAGAVPDGHAARGGNGGGKNRVGGDYTASDGVQINQTSGAFDYEIVGTDGRDEIYAGPGKDLIYGMDDRDEITARGGNDEIHGGAGTDIIDGGDGDDLIYGDEDGDVLDGGAGTDQLLGGDGDDQLSFSLGAFDGTNHAVDTYDGGAGIDQLSFHNADRVIIDMSLGTYEALATDSAGNQSTVRGDFWNIESVWGSPGDDVLDGDEYADDILVGGDGNDVINGFGGDDVIHAEGGDDIVHGGAGDDIITGWGGNDVLYGDDGNDRLSGPGGDQNNDDVLHGGNGCDVFVFERRFGIDTIADYNFPYNESGCDSIDLSDYNPKMRLDYGDLDIDVVGTDIVIDFWLTKMGGEGGTIILKDAVSNGVLIDDLVFVF